MSETAIARFICDGCGRSYRWKLELAGKKVKCGCGNVMVAPESGVVEPPAPPPEDIDGLYDLAPDPENKIKPKQMLPESGGVCPACSAALVEGAKICVQCGFDLIKKKTLSGESVAPKPPGSAPKAPAALVMRAMPVAYQRPTTAGVTVTERLFVDRVKDLYMPLALIVGGTIVQFAFAAYQFRFDDRGPIWAMSRIGIHMVVNTTVMLMAILIVARVRSINFGALPVAILKLSAVAMAPRAIALLASPLLNVIPALSAFGFLTVSFVFYFALLGALFDLDQSDTWYCMTMMAAVAIGLYFGIRGLGLGEQYIF